LDPLPTLAGAAVAEAAMTGLFVVGAAVTGLFVGGLETEGWELGLSEAVTEGLSLLVTEGCELGRSEAVTEGLSLLVTEGWELGLPEDTIEGLSLGLGLVVAGAVGVGLSVHKSAETSNPGDGHRTINTRFDTPLKISKFSFFFEKSVMRA
jgi:hypothetical protein